MPQYDTHFNRAAKAVGLVIPELKGKLDGIAMRVPVTDGSITDLTVVLEKRYNSGGSKCAREESGGNELKGIVEYTEEELVSSDIVGTTVSSVFDSKLTAVMGNLLKVCAWYDNEYGYSCRVVDLAEKMMKM